MMEQITIFGLMGGKEAEEENLLKEALKRGSNIEGFKDRLMENIELKEKDFVEFLKKEFGIGGYTDCGGISVWFNASGMEVRKTIRDEGKHYDWVQIARKYREMYYGGFEW